MKELEFLENINDLDPELLEDLERRVARVKAKRRKN